MVVFIDVYLLLLLYLFVLLVVALLMEGLVYLLRCFVAVCLFRVHVSFVGVSIVAGSV